MNAIHSEYFTEGFTVTVDNYMAVLRAHKEYWATRPHGGGGIHDVLDVRAVALGRQLYPFQPVTALAKEEMATMQERLRKDLGAEFLAEWENDDEWDFEYFKLVQADIAHS